MPNPCLLEAGQLPIMELADFAVREGRRPRPIYTGHKWFARRLGSVFRALLVGATSPPDDNFWNLYYGDADLRDVVVLDPFVGGGTSVVESLRLGATTHAVDVDPVACAVTQFEIEAAGLPDLTGPLHELQKSVGDRVRRFHVKIDTEGVERVVLHHFWVQIISCEHCGKTFEAHPNFVLGDDGKHRWVVCSRCGDIHRRRAGHERFRCGTCGAQTRIAEGNVTYGKARCPNCQKRRPLIQIGRALEEPPTWRLFAIEVLDEPDGGRPVPISQRRFLKATNADVVLYEAAASELRQRLQEYPECLPRAVTISHDRTDSRLIDYGYRNWTQLFNARQLLHLSLLSEAISAYDGPTRRALSIAFSDHLTTNCMMAAYAAGWRRLTPLFSIRAFRHIQRPVELNPWCDGTGRGTYPNTIRKLMRASRFAREPKEPKPGGGFRRTAPRDSNKPPNVICGTAKDLSFLRDRAVDLVLTDPPYLDNISYSELADFFAPWLEFLEVINDSRSRERITMESLIGYRDNADSVKHYSEGLSSAFAEIGRVLKNNGLLVFSFRHSSTDAWGALANGLAKSCLRVVSFLPVPGEAGAGPHTRAGTGLWDAVFVMRKMAQERVLEGLELRKDQIKDVKVRVSKWALELKGASIPFSAADELSLFRAGLVATALKAQPRGRASKMVPLDSVLSTSSQIVSD